VVRAGGGLNRPAVRIDRVPASSPAAAALMAELDLELGARYPDTPIFGLRAGEAADPSLRFLVATIAGRLAGCGALRHLGDGQGELKRMYVRREYRGQGVARALLQALEREAGDVGVAVLRVQTGNAQPEALALYRGEGYRDIPPFGEYRASEVSICLERRLASPSVRPSRPGEDPG
jgi:putative acetyltransferase